MFSGQIVWKGLVYTILMILGKVVCGVWLLRLSFKIAIPSSVRRRLPNLHRPRLDHFWGRASKQPVTTTAAESQGAAPDASGRALPPSASTIDETSSSRTSPGENAVATSNPHAAPAGIKPRSIYPASILGCAMTARGEIGFLISSLGESHRIFASESDKQTSSDIFLVVTWAIVLCTTLGPLAVGLIVQRVKKLQHGVEKEGRPLRGDVLGVWGVS